MLSKILQEDTRAAVRGGAAAALQDLAAAARMAARKDEEAVLIETRAFSYFDTLATPYPRVPNGWPMLLVPHRIFGIANLNNPLLTNIPGPSMLSPYGFEAEGRITRVRSKLWVEDRGARSDLYGMFEATTQVQLEVGCMPHERLQLFGACDLSAAGVLNASAQLLAPALVPARQNLGFEVIFEPAFADTMNALDSKKLLRFFIDGTLRRYMPRKYFEKGTPFEIACGADGRWPVNQWGFLAAQQSDQTCIILTASENAHHLIGQWHARQPIPNITGPGFIKGRFVRDIN